MVQHASIYNNETTGRVLWVLYVSKIHLLSGLCLEPQSGSLKHTNVNLIVGGKRVCYPSPRIPPHGLGLCPQISALQASWVHHCTPRQIPVYATNLRTQKNINSWRLRLCPRPHWGAYVPPCGKGLADPKTPPPLSAIWASNSGNY